MPEAGATVIVHGLDTRKACAAMSAALTAPYDVNGAAHLPSRANHGARTCIRVEGFEGSVTYRSGQLKDLLGRFGDVTIEADTSDRAETVATHTRCGNRRFRQGRCLAHFREAVRRTRLATALGDDAQLQFDWGGGLVWACVPQGSDVRTAMTAIDGHATLVRSSEATAKSAWCVPAGSGTPCKDQRRAQGPL